MRHLVVGLLAVALVVTVLALAVGSAALLEVNGGTIAVYGADNVFPAPSAVPVGMTFQAREADLRQYPSFSVIVQLPQALALSHVDQSSFFLTCSDPPPCPYSAHSIGHEVSGRQLTVYFPRHEPRGPQQAPVEQSEQSEEIGAAPMPVEGQEEASLHQVLPVPSPLPGRQFNWVMSGTVYGWPAEINLDPSLHLPLLRGSH
jgi:hypothetical protein